MSDIFLSTYVGKGLSSSHESSVEPGHECHSIRLQFCLRVYEFRESRLLPVVRVLQVPPRQVFTINGNVRKPEIERENRPGWCHISVVILYDFKQVALGVPIGIGIPIGIRLPIDQIFVNYVNNFCTNNQVGTGQRCRQRLVYCGLLNLR